MKFLLKKTDNIILTKCLFKEQHPAILAKKGFMMKKIIATTIYKVHTQTTPKVITPGRARYEIIKALAANGTGIAEALFLLNIAAHFISPIDAKPQFE